MFWKIIKWGGTAVFTILIIAIGILADIENTAMQQPSQQPVQTGSKFNF